MGLYTQAQKSDVEHSGDVSIESGGSLDVESGATLEIAGTAIAATAAELNVLDAAVAAAVFTVGSEAGNVINVAVQLNDANGVAMAVRSALPFYMSDDANGDSLAAAAADGGIAIGTDGVLIEWTANLAGLAISEADGDIDIDITESGADTWYLVLVLPNGKLAVSGAITFA